METGEESPARLVSRIRSALGCLKRRDGMGERVREEAADAIRREWVFVCVAPTSNQSRARSVVGQSVDSRHGNQEDTGAEDVVSSVDLSRGEQSR